MVHMHTYTHMRRPHLSPLLESLSPLAPLRDAGARVLVARHPPGISTHRFAVAARSRPRMASRPSRRSRANASVGARAARGTHDLLREGDLYYTILHAAKAQDPAKASRLLVDAAHAGVQISAHMYGAVVVACANICALSQAEVWIGLMAAAGHRVSPDLARTIVATLLSHAGCLDTSGLPEVGRWIRRLHSAGSLPLVRSLAVEVFRHLDRSGRACQHEADEWAVLEFRLSLREVVAPGVVDLAAMRRGFTFMGSTWLEAARLASAQEGPG